MKPFASASLAEAGVFAIRQTLRRIIREFADDPNTAVRQTIDAETKNRFVEEIRLHVDHKVVAGSGTVDVFADKRIAYLKGDWTNRNPEITRLLEQFGRSGVPLYVLYRGGRDPLVLPQILTQSLVLDALKKI